MESGQSVKVKGIEKDKVTLWEGLCLGQGLDSVHWDNHIFPKPEKLSESRTVNCGLWICGGEVTLLICNLQEKSVMFPFVRKDRGMWREGMINNLSTNYPKVTSREREGERDGPI